jgi:phosphatidylglycerophosphate synthase
LLGERLGHHLDRPLRSLSFKIKVHPNLISITGFIITLFSAFLIPIFPFYAGIVLCIGGFLDMFDGIIARNRNLVSSFGAFLDSTLDRLSDGALFTSVAVSFYLKDSPTYSFITLLSLIFSFLVSYERARIEGLGGHCRVGLAERPERIILLITGLITGYLQPAIWIILITSLITALQRGYHAWKLFQIKESKNGD